MIDGKYSRSAGDWIEQRISVYDYLEKYAGNPDVRLITHSEKCKMVSVLIRKSHKDKLISEHIALSSFF